MKAEKRGKIIGALIGVLMALIVCALILRGMGALLMGGAQLLHEAGGAEMPISTPVPTMPPLVEEAPADQNENGQEESGRQIEVPVEMTPEELAENAPDLTPPPDAPIG